MGRLTNAEDQKMNENRVPVLIALVAYSELLWVLLLRS